MHFWLLTYTAIFYWQSFIITERPAEPPRLSGMEAEYDRGSILNVTCQSSPGLPPPALEWAINGQKVSEGHMMLDGPISLWFFGFMIKLSTRANIIAKNWLAQVSEFMVSPGSNKTITLQLCRYLHLFKVPAFSTNTSYQADTGTDSARMLAITMSRLVVKLTSSGLPSRITVKWVMPGKSTCAHFNKNVYILFIRGTTLPQIITYLPDTNKPLDKNQSN